LEGGEKE
jgi:hypothetical protein